MKSGFLFVSVIFALIMACEKPKERQAAFDASLLPTMVFQTSLADTIPKSTYNELKLKHEVVGIKIKDGIGNDIRYFEYQTNPDELLAALGKSPFWLDDFVSDTLVRRISADAMKERLASTNIDAEYAAAFAGNITAETEVFECVKIPLIHHLIVDRKQEKVYHRVIVSG